MGYGLNTFRWIQWADYSQDSLLSKQDSWDGTRLLNLSHSRHLTGLENTQCLILYPQDTFNEVKNCQKSHVLISPQIKVYKVQPGTTQPKARQFLLLKEDKLRNVHVTMTNVMFLTPQRDVLAVGRENSHLPRQDWSHRGHLLSLNIHQPAKSSSAAEHDWHSHGGAKKSHLFATLGSLTCVFFWLLRHKPQFRELQDAVTVGYTHESVGGGQLPVTAVCPH